MTAPGPLLILTMPGFGIEVLRHLVRAPAWPAASVRVALVGTRPAAWRRVAAGCRWTLRRPEDRGHRLADGTLAAGEAESFLQAQGLPWCWLQSDDAVRAHRAALRPALTLTLTSRILFSARTLADAGGDWLNVHPGLLPEYAGAAPAPYMFLDGCGGCTIHVMAAQVDAGAVIDRAPMAGELGSDGGDYFFHRLPPHTAGRVAALLQDWADGRGWASVRATDSRALRHCSSRRLARDRQLDWRWPVDRLVRWVAALAAFAPAWFDDGHGHRIEVMTAEPGAPASQAAPGTFQARQGRWIEVACAEGTARLRCRVHPHAGAGQCLPLPGAEPGGSA